MACLLSLAAGRLCAQDYMEKFLNSLYTENDEHKIIAEDHCVFILLNNRNCLKCFNDACIYLDKPAFRKYKIYFVIILQDDLMAMLPTVSMYKKAAPCASEVLVHFIKKEQEQSFYELYTVPTPQLIIKSGNSLQHVSYTDFRRITGT